MSALLPWGGDLESIAWQLGLCAIVLGLIWVARLHPLISLAMGLVLLAVPLLQWLAYGRYLRFDIGSAVGLIFLLVYAAFALSCGILGLVFASSGAIALSGRATAWRPRISTAHALGVVGIAAALAMALLGYVWKGRDWMAARELERDRKERIAHRAVQVTERYTLSWRQRHGAPALRLAVPVADLRRPWLKRVAHVQEGDDGPLRLELVLATPEAADAALRLYRDWDAERLDTVGIPLRDGPRFRVQARDGAWTFLGNDAPSGLARSFPWAFGVAEVALRTAEVGERNRRRCVMEFHYAERPVVVEADAPCTGPSAAQALAASVQLLGRLARDTDSPPPAEARLARVRAAAKQCAEAAQEEARKALCDYAIQLGGAELQSAGAEAGDALVRGMVGAMSTIGMPPSMAGSEWLQQGFEALGGGRGDGREALLAHTLRLASIGNSKDTARVKAFDESLAAVATLAAKHAAAEDPLFELLSQVLGNAVLESEARKAANLELMRGWDEKARATHAGTDIAAKARFRHCFARLRLEAQYAGLNACADELLAAWEARAAGGKTFEPFYTEGDLAIEIGRMYAAHGHASGDFPSALASLRRAQQLAAKRFPADSRVFEFLRWSEEGLEKARKLRGG